MYLRKQDPSTEEKIHISVNGAASHTWNQCISAEDWESMVSNIESSIDSAFRNESFEVVIKYLKAEKKMGEKRKSFSKEKVDLAEVFGSVVPKAA